MTFETYDKSKNWSNILYKKIDSLKGEKLSVEFYKQHGDVALSR